MRHGTRNRHRRYTPNAAKHKAKLTQSRSKSCEAEDGRKEDETVDIACEKGSTAVPPSVRRSSASRLMPDYRSVLSARAQTEGLPGGSWRKHDCRSRRLELQP